MNSSTCAFLLAAALAAAAPPAPAAHAGTSAAVHAQDWRFMHAAGELGNAQIVAGKLASANGMEPEVRALGKRLLRENKAANHRLNMLSLETQIPVPVRPAARDRKSLDRLKALTGEAFDHNFLAGPGVHLQEKAVALLRREAASPTAHPALRRFARQRLPEAESTLQEAKRLQDRNIS